MITLPDTGFTRTVSEVHAKIANLLSYRTAFLSPVLWDPQTPYRVGKHHCRVSQYAVLLFKTYTRIISYIYMAIYSIDTVQGWISLGFIQGSQGCWVSKLTPYGKTVCCVSCPSGQSRANMIPLKQPRNPKASDDTLPTADPEGSDGGPKATPPPLPKKNIARANTEPSALGRELLAPRPKGEAKPGGSNLSVANPLYDLDSTWETASQGSSMGSEVRPPDQESGDSLERPAAGKGRPATSLSCMTSPATVSAGRQPKRGCRSVESLSGRGRGSSRSQRAGLYKGMDNWEEVLGRIRGLHTDTLRKLACRCEDRFMAGQKDPLRFGTDSWSDFRLTTGRPCCEAGDAVYYTASYAKDPLVNYAVKVRRRHSASLSVYLGRGVLRTSTYSACAITAHAWISFRLLLTDFMLWSFQG